MGGDYVAYLDYNGLEYYNSKINNKFEELRNEIKKSTNAVPCRKIAMPAESVNVFVNIPYQLPSPILSPSDSTDSVTYISNDINICNVTSDGVVTASNYGVTTITILCGNCQTTIKVIVSMYLPKNVGKLAFLEAVKSDNTFNIYVGGSNTVNYVIPYIDYPIQPGATIHIECDNVYYTIVRFFVINDGYTLSMSNSYNFSNVELIQNFTQTYKAASVDYTNTTQTNQYLMISFQFYADAENNRTSTSESITDEQLQSFYDRNNVYITMSPADTEEASNDGIQIDTSSVTGITDEIKEALLNCFQNVAWSVDNGNNYYYHLMKALNNEVNTRQYLSYFDFTKSIADEEGLFTPVLNSASEYNPPSRDTFGLHFTEPTQSIYFGTMDPVGKTFEFDIANLSFAGDTSYHVRLMMFTDGTHGTSPLIWRTGQGWSGYGYSKYANTTKIWYNNVWSGMGGTTADSINLLNNSTVKLVFESTGKNTSTAVSLYINNVFIEKKVGLYFSTLSAHNCERFSFGAITSSGAQSAGDQCYNLTLTSVRVYENEEA